MFLFFIFSFCLFPSLCTKSVSPHENNPSLHLAALQSAMSFYLFASLFRPILERLTLFAASTSWPFAVWLLCLPLYWNSILTESLITSYFPHLTVFSKLSSSDLLQYLRMLITLFFLTALPWTYMTLQLLLSNLCDCLSLISFLNRSLYLLCKCTY